MKDYLDLGLIADYYRWRNGDDNFNSYIPTGLNDESSLTPQSILSADIIPETLQSQRSLALVYAAREIETPKLTDLMYSYQDELCFQLYAACSTKIEGIIPRMLQRIDLTIEELAILTSFADNSLFNSEVLRADALEYIQKRAEILLSIDPKIVYNPCFDYVCSAGYNYTDIGTNWKNAKTSTLKERSRSVRYFSGMRVSYKDLLKAVNAVMQGVIYNSPVKQLLNELLGQVNIWSESEFQLVMQLVTKVNTYTSISRYQNYTRLYAAVPFKAALFRLCKFDQFFTQKFAVLTFSERVKALTVTFMDTKSVQKNLIPAYLPEVKQVFRSYDSRLQDAWDSCWHSLNGCWDYHYPCNFIADRIAKKKDMTKYLELLDDHTLNMFLMCLDNEQIANAVAEYCQKHSMLQALQKDRDKFSQHVQTKIAISVKKYNRGIHPDLPPKTKLSDVQMTLQPFVLKTKITFTELDRDEQILLGHCISTDCKLKKKEIVQCVKFANECTQNQHEILRTLLRVGYKWHDNVRHYYTDLRLYECEFKEDVVCCEEFKYMQPGQTLAEASYFRGRTFKRTRDINQKFDDKTLNFFQWCGTDEYNATGLKADNETAFAKYFARTVLGQDIDSWKIEEGSPLLEIRYLKQVDWQKRANLLCKSNTHYLVSTDVPASLLDIPKSEQECKNIIANLKRHPAEWYQSFNNWKDILVYDFEWDYDSCMVAEDVIASGASTKSQLFLKVYTQFGYTDPKHLMANAILLVTKK